MSAVRLLRIAGVVEAASLAVLLINLATIHLAPVSSLLGPVHGCAYLLVIGSALSVRPAALGTRLLSLVPGIGGLLALRLLTPRPEPDRSLP
ncbi:DUF3817 domain-containing protein [Microlunatus speluncae]|uniref:DUF3817 domain-containing protein n=1 Tax=Microlunatus speluncae TaxID=2594267 RepID=UPI001266861F|nr:DUF3817 domain-containing protein [Microlunatus speluncae]